MPWFSEYENRKTDGCFKKHTQTRAREAVDQTPFLILFLLSSTSLSSQPLVLFTPFPSLWGKWELRQVDFTWVCCSLKNLTLPCPPVPVGLRATDQGRRTPRDTSGGTWEWSRDLQISQDFPHFFKGLAYQATLFNLPPSGALPKAGHPRFIQTPLFSGNPLA